MPYAHATHYKLKGHTSQRIERANDTALRKDVLMAEIPMHLESNDCLVQCEPSGVVAVVIQRETISLIVNQGASQARVARVAKRAIHDDVRCRCLHSGCRQCDPFLAFIIKEDVRCH